MEDMKNKTKQKNPKKTNKGPPHSYPQKIKKQNKIKEIRKERKKSRSLSNLSLLGTRRE